MDIISTFTIKNKEVNLMYKGGFLAYAFEHEGQNYGNKVELTSKKTIDIASATFLLFENALSSIENLNDITRTGTGTEEVRPEV